MSLNITEIKYYTGSEFKSDIPSDLLVQIAKLYTRVFAQDPYYEEYTQEQALQAITGDCKCPSIIFLEKDTSDRPILFASFYTTNLKKLVVEVYDSSPEVTNYFEELVPIKFVYFSEIFADKELRQRGNLANIDSILKDVCNKLDSNTVFLSTKTGAVLSALKNLGNKNWVVNIFTPEQVRYQEYSFIILKNNTSYAK